ncbi:MAG: sulfite exporter TauE/SafE family protein [Verrucomicrobiota bacterium]
MPGEEFQYLEYLLIFALFGLVSGYASGLFGIGGGILRIPIFVLIFPAFGIHGDVEMPVAAATSLALAVPAGYLALRKQMKLGNFDPAYFRSWAIGLTVGVLIGITAGPYVSSFALKICFLVFLLAMAVYFGLVPDHVVVCRQPPTGLPQILLSGSIGAYVVMIGVAGGAAATPVMKACSLPLTRALAIGSGTSMIVSALGTAGGIWNGWGVPGRPDWCLGFIDGIIFLAMFPGIYLATPWGVATGHRLDKQWLKRIYAVFLLAISVVMVAHLLASG